MTAPDNAMKRAAEEHERKHAEQFPIRIAEAGLVGVDLLNDYAAGFQAGARWAFEEAAKVCTRLSDYHLNRPGNVSANSIGIPLELAQTIRQLAGKGEA